MMKKIMSLLLIGLLSVTLIGCEEKDNDDKSKDTKVEEKVSKKELDIEDDLVQKYYNIIRDDFGEFYSAYLSKKDTKVSDLDYTAMFAIAARMLTEEEVEDKGGAYYYIKRADLEKRAKELFGDDIKFDYSKGTDLNLFVQVEGSPLYAMTLFGSYDKKTEKYEFYWGGIGGTCGLDDCYLRRSKLDSAYITGDKLYITEKQLYEFQDWHYEDGFKKAALYSDYDRKNEVGSYTEQNYSLDEFYEKAGSVTYVFKENKDGNYIFVESIVKK